MATRDFDYQKLLEDDLQARRERIRMYQHMMAQEDQDAPRRDLLISGLLDVEREQVAIIEAELQSIGTRRV